MKHLLLWMLVCGVPTLARAQETPSPPGEEEPSRALEPEAETPAEPAPEPPAETTPPPTETPAAEEPPRRGRLDDDDDGDRAVVGNRPPADGSKVRRPPPPPPPKPKATVQRDKDGKVILPTPPRPLADLVAPNRSQLSGPQRAWVTGAQVLWGAVFGGGAFVCGACACPPLLLATVFGGPLIGAVAMGLYMMVVAPLHVGMAALGLFVPAYFRDPDWVAGAAGVAGVAAVDLLALMAGGIVATAVVLRWAPSPSNSTIKLRGPVPLALLPELRGTDLALALNVLAVTSVMVFVAPLVGVGLYTLVGLLRGDPAPQLEAKVEPGRATRTPDAPAPRRKRRTRPRSAP